VWKNLPLAMHKDAPLAHQAAMAAHEQGKFWEYHDQLFLDPKKLKWEDLKGHARKVGLDLPRFEQAVLSTRLKPAVDADASEAAAMGITGTPAFLVNGRYLSGAKPFEAFAELIDAELRKRGLPVPPPAPAPA
jgi:predicted DsbA family dithiol-disulfide isomerase